jgi:hypothetical protein
MAEKEDSYPPNSLAQREPLQLPRASTDNAPVLTHSPLHSANPGV